MVHCIGRFSLCLMLCVVASCGSIDPSRAGSSSSQLRQLIKERRYHEAYALVDVVMEEIHEGAVRGTLDHIARKAALKKKG